jgi:hypothetical protein
MFALFFSGVSPSKVCIYLISLVALLLPYSLSLSLSRELETREGVSLYRCDTGTTCRTLSSYVNPEAAGPLTDSLTHREKFLRVHVPRYVLYYVPLLSS